MNTIGHTFCLISPLVSLLILSSAADAADLIFAKGSKWELVSTGHKFAEGMTWDRDGHFLFTDVPRSQLFRIDKDSGEKTLLDGKTRVANGIAFGPDKRLYGCAMRNGGVNTWDPESWEKEILGDGVSANDLAILADGTIFFTDPPGESIWRIDPTTRERSLAAKLDWKPNGIGLSADESTLLVAEFEGSVVHGFAINKENRLEEESRPAYRLAVPENGVGYLDGMQSLKDGRLLIGTSLGLQLAAPIHDKNTNPAIILVPPPEGRKRCNYVRISPDNQWIYTAYADDILRRRLIPNFGLGKE